MRPADDIVDAMLLERLVSRATMRKFVVIDASVDGQFTHTTVIDLSNADGAIILIDAREPLVPRTLWLVSFLSLLGVRSVMLAVDKMDTVEDPQSVFEGIAAEYRAMAERAGVADFSCVPVLTPHGDNIGQRSTTMSWYVGPTLNELLERIPAPPPKSAVAPPRVAGQFQATVVWMHERPMLPGRSYLANVGAQSVPVTVAPLKYRLDVITREHLAARQLTRNDIGVCGLEFAQPIAFAPYNESRELGRAVLIDRVTNAAVGVALLEFALSRSHNIRWQYFEVDKEARAGLKAQRPAVLWFTGLSGAGKSTIANLVEQRLYALGCHTYVLDGDNVRHGLNKDLGFTEADRVENIRRVAEVARLMVDGGLIVLVSFISPFRAERQMARELMAPGEFLEIFVDTPLLVAEQRDPKGLYRKARRGELRHFTGVDSPYEPPENPEVHIDTTRTSAEAAAAAIVEGLFAARIVDR